MTAALTQVSVGVRLSQALPHTSCWLLHQRSHTEWEAAVPEPHHQEWEREMGKPICTTKQNRQESGVQRMHKPYPCPNTYPAKPWQPTVFNKAWLGLLWFGCYYRDKGKKRTWSWSPFPTLMILHGMRLTHGRAEHLPLQAAWKHTMPGSKMPSPRWKTEGIEEILFILPNPGFR